MDQVLLTHLPSISLMWVKQYHKPPITGNGKHTTYKNGDFGGWFIMVTIVLPTLTWKVGLFSLFWGCQPTLTRPKWQPCGLFALPPSWRPNVLWTIFNAGPFALQLAPCIVTQIIYYRRKFRSETSDNMDSWKAEVRRVRRDKIRRKKMQMREKVGKSRFTVFVQWFGAPEGRKVGSLKRRVRSQLARWDMKKCTPLWREAHFQVKMDKTLEERTTFGSWDVEKVHAVVARSTFGRQNVQNTPMSDHFWKLRCRKSARRCGAKHIWKAECTKHTNVGPLLEVAMSKKCTPLWREAHLEGKMYKTHQCSKKCTPLWREAHFEVKSVKNCGVLSLFWRDDVETVDTD